MLEILDNYYSSIRGKGSWSRFRRVFVRLLTNFLMPFIFFFRRYLVRNRLLFANEIIQEEVIVSLTTFPMRIDRLWLVVESIRRQTYQPNKIILWLSSKQFPDNIIPTSLQWYVNNYILEIRFVNEDIRSFKKFYYCLEEFPESVVITIDDDILYKKSLIEELSLAYKNSGRLCVCAHRGYDVLKDENNLLLPYNTWNKSMKYGLASSNIFHTSGGGTLYKKVFFDNRVFDKQVFIEKCLYADDVWLNLMLQLKQTKTILLNDPSLLLPLVYKNNITLSAKNVGECQNDRQIKSVVSYYEINSKDLFNT